jgi:hypothetical protein
MQYASKSCSDSHAKLASANGELLAIVWGIQKFSHYLAGRAFTLVCDNSALQFLHHGKNSNPTLARYAMQLAQYDFKVKHKQGKLHTNADGLTRAHKPVH